ncbi:dethiobiotin synthase [Agarivorans aestuarii]|uniref:ATP-dependent dethiobiotin synthetase BioD n=1 Tax=Agarivorans aestuarii TaxID=1563703 RepID=A0ABU7FYX9_9ALTE|nr:dethiobiotin synthase [Agarivorans aestuarii]MEE1672357.1 dethiobiotin synthase [Agarivorans aestuarii]
MASTIFVTGTDTEVGKTVVSCGLVKALQDKFSVVNGYKPIAAGTEIYVSGEGNEDAFALMDVNSSVLEYSEVNPVMLQHAIAPHIAANIENKPVNTKLMTGSLQNLSSKSDFVVVEGAGGWHVPLNDSGLMMSNWVAEQQIPVVLVVGVKLGCLNHALLTVEAIKASGCKLVAWVANNLNETSDISKLNIRYLQAAIEAPCIAELPYNTSLDADLAAECFELDALISKI